MPQPFTSYGGIIRRRQQTRHIPLPKTRRKQTPKLTSPKLKPLTDQELDDIAAKWFAEPIHDMDIQPSQKEPSTAALMPKMSHRNI